MHRAVGVSHLPYYGASGEESEWEEGVEHSPTQSSSTATGSVCMTDILCPFERLDTRHREDDARRHEEDMQWEEHCLKKFQQLIISTMASQATAHERERQDLEELRRSEVAEDQADREHEEHEERDLDKKRLHKH